MGRCSKYNPNLGVDGNNKTQTYITLGSIPHRRLLLLGYLAEVGSEQLLLVLHQYDMPRNERELHTS